MNNSNRKFLSRTLGLAGLMLVSVGSAAATEAESQNASAMRTLTAQAEEARTKQFQEIEKLIAKAENLYDEGSYAEAERVFVVALDALRPLPGELAASRFAEVLAEYDKMCRAWGEGLLADAIKDTRSEPRRLTVALQKASEALSREEGARKYLAARNNEKLVPGDFAARIAEFSELCRKMQNGDEFTRATSFEEFNKNYEQNQEKITRLIREAKTFYSNQKYEDAVLRLEKVYLIDPFNQTAASMLQKVYTQMYSAANARHKAEIMAQLGVNNWTWVEPVFPSGLDSTSERQAEIKASGSDSVFARMERIVFPNVDFEDADIFTVVRFLNSRSKNYDPEKEGVNFIVVVDKTVADKLNRVNMNFTKIPLNELLRYLCQDVELKYKVEGDNVVIGRTVDEMQTQSFSVRGDLISNISGVAVDGGDQQDIDPMAAAMEPQNAPMNMMDPMMGAGAADAAPGNNMMGVGAMGGGDGLTVASRDAVDINQLMSGASTIRTDRVNSAKLQKYFAERGVKFEKGSSITYNRRTGKLIVRNTVDNLRRLDELLRQLDSIETPLIMVEVKLVEVTDKDAQELGFEWALNMVDTSDSKNTQWTETTGNPVRSSNALINPNSAISSDIATATGGSVKLLNNLKIFPNFGNGIFKDVDVNLNLTVNAISQNLRTEVLSVPKVVTSSGSTAKIDMTRRYYFPSSWEEPSFDTSGNFSTVEVPTPEWEDEGNDIGIMLEVTPQVDPDNYTITMHLHPMITEYIGKTDDTVTLSQGYIDYADETPQYITTWSQTYSVWLPIIGVREIEVDIKVYDGETIVLGGMVDNKTTTLYDRWPILGELPLVGRFFCSQYESKDNSNLLVFVTARLINNDGMPMRRTADRGIPDFRR